MWKLDTTGAGHGQLVGQPRVPPMLRTNAKKVAICSINDTDTDTGPRVYFWRFSKLSKHSLVGCQIEGLCMRKKTTAMNFRYHARGNRNQRERNCLAARYIKLKIP